MYLKSIELFGFKSFMERTKVKLDGGVACIVGPNGSGKSNIADAVRWVLGEQSVKTLRGQKMEDVIFAGSSKRKPLGMAEVVLNMDNSDGSLPVEFQEVSVARRVYRSGDSEYLLNGKQCRLKDIQELFMDSGVGNNSLALVGQGRVQEIVNMKPDERRGLIEEAAGVIKYRNRKKTATRKLLDTEQNLERIWDIITELAERIEPLKIQSTKAQKYLELKKSADSQEINLLLQVLAKNKADLAVNVASQSERNDIILNQNAILSSVVATLEQAKFAHQQLEENLTALRQDVFDLKTAKERDEAKAILIEEKIKTVGEHISRLTLDLELIFSRDDGFMSEVDRLNQEQNSLGLEVKTLKSEIQSKEQNFDIAKTTLEDLTAELSMLRDELFENASQLANARNELNYQDRSISNNEVQLKTMAENIEVLANDNSSVDGAIANMKAEIADTKGVQATKNNELAAVETKISTLMAEKIKVSEAEVAIRMKLNSEQSRLKILQEMAENQSNFYPGVRALLRGKKQNAAYAQNMYGVLVDLISSDVKYSVALEAALGASMQNVVVKDDGCAKACINFLKTERLGRATFLPIASLRIRENREIDGALNKVGVIGRASSLITCDAEIQPAVDFLLGNILIVENLDNAIKIAKEHQQKFRIITLDGDVITPGGAISGGSRQKNTGDLLQKKNQLEQLKKDVHRLAAESENQKLRIAKFAEDEVKISGERDLLQSEIRELEMLLMGKVKDLDHLENSQADKATQLQIMKIDFHEMELEQARLIRRKGELGEEVSSWESQNHAANQNLLLQQTKIEAQNLEVEKEREALEQLRLVAVKKEQEHSTLHNELARLKAEKGSLFEEKANKETELANYKNELVSLNAAKVENAVDVAKMAERIVKGDGEVAQKFSELAEIKANLEELQKAEANANAEISKASQELHQLEIKATRLEAEEQNQSQKLAETFELTYDEAIGYLDETVSQSDLSKNVRSLKSQISALGNVNLDAIDEYAMVRERHDFLSAQREDLLEARDALNKVIAEMDAIMTKRFKEAFTLVNENFNHTFAKLFGGGSAGLMMTIPDDILETGVDMVVQPPGKKLVNYNLLSGGEKSLVGIALVLAVFQVRPSPFCILDEVDAALDEANVDRFAEYVRQFAENTQFVVVSHRQGTMEVADSLWGVTMEEDGVSKMVSVKLSENLDKYLV